MNRPRPERPLRIGLVSGPMVAIPPPGYAGTERVVAVLVNELTRRGHAVTLIGPADSQVDCELVPTIHRPNSRRNRSVRLEKTTRPPGKGASSNPTGFIGRHMHADAKPSLSAAWFQEALFSSVVRTV